MSRIIRGVGLAAALCTAAVSAQAEEWYLPRPTNVLTGGALEIGTRAQFAFDRNGLQFDRNADMTLSVRYSPVNRLELYVEGPYSYIEQERVTFPALIASTDQEGFGDLYAQVSWDAAGAQDWKVILSTDIVFPTGKNPYEDNRALGDGFYKFTPGLTFIKVIDPAALYAYLGHQWTVPDEWPGFGKIEPGEDFRFRLGLSVSLNPRIRANVFTAGDIIGHTRIRSIEQAGTDQDVLRFGGGLSWNVSEHWKCDWSAVFGATDNSTDAIISLGASWTR